MKFSSKIQRCELSPMRKFLPYELAAEAKGRKIYHLNIGQPDIETPKAFFDAVKKGVQTPIDVYDMAAWMSITPLSEASIAMGGAPVAIPDFTNGRWINREPIQEGHYCLEKICE